MLIIDITKSQRVVGSACFPSTWECVQGICSIPLGDHFPSLFSMYSWRIWFGSFDIQVATLKFWSDFLALLHAGSNPGAREQGRPSEQSSGHSSASAWDSAPWNKLHLWVLWQVTSPFSSPLFPLTHSTSNAMLCLWIEEWPWLQVRAQAGPASQMNACRGLRGLLGSTLSCAGDTQNLLQLSSLN